MKTKNLRFIDLFQCLCRFPGLSAIQGSVFVEFAEYSSAEAFLKADPKPTWDEKELLIMSKYVLSSGQ